MHGSVCESDRQLGEISPHQGPDLQRLRSYFETCNHGRRMLTPLIQSGIKLPGTPRARTRWKHFVSVKKKNAFLFVSRIARVQIRRIDVQTRLCVN